MKFLIGLVILYFSFCFLAQAEGPKKVVRRGYGPGQLFEYSALNKGKTYTAPDLNVGPSKCDVLPDTTKRLLFNFFNTVAKNNPQEALKNFAKFAKLCGMVSYESNGNPVDYSDMVKDGAEKNNLIYFRDNHYRGSIAMFDTIRTNKKIRRDHQTNIGLIQISLDILTWNPELQPIFEKVISRASKSSRSFLDICGTSDVFSDAKQVADFMTTKSQPYKNCKLQYRIEKKSNGSSVPYFDEAEMACFDHWLSFCPNLNIALADKLPMAFFESKDAAPICQEELSLILSVSTAKSLKEIDGMLGIKCPTCPN